MHFKLISPTLRTVESSASVLSSYAYHANVLNYEDADVNRFFCEALFMIGYGESVETLLPTVLKVGEINLKCMALLDKASS